MLERFERLEFKHEDSCLVPIFVQLACQSTHDLDLSRFNTPKAAKHLPAPSDLWRERLSVVISLHLCFRNVWCFNGIERCISVGPAYDIIDEH